jgi:hypothetical protein
VSRDRACDLLLAEGRLSVDPSILDFNPEIDRGEMITSANGNGNGSYKRYLITESGVSPRAVPGFPATPTSSPATSTMKTACSSATNTPTR